MIRHAFIASLWGGLLALDITGFGPWLIAQPMVVGPFFGWLLGHVESGVIIGGVVQLLWMDITPVGVGIPYDAMAVTLLAVFWSTLSEHSISLAQIVLALLIAVPFGSVFKFMDLWSRRFNTRILHHIESVKDDYLSVALSAGIVAGLLWSFLRYALTYFLSMLIGIWVWGKLSPFLRIPSVDRGLGMAAILLPLAGMSITLDLFLSEEPDTRWLARLGFKSGIKPKAKS